jgi:hypothetical protein
VLRRLLAGRRSLLWLLGPPVLYLAAVPLVNRVEPRLFGLPFLLVWLLAATVVTPLFVRAAAHGDPVWRAAAGSPEPERDRDG